MAARRLVLTGYVAHRPGLQNLLVEMENGIIDFLKSVLLPHELER